MHPVATCCDSVAHTRKGDTRLQPQGLSNIATGTKNVCAAVTRSTGELTLPLALQIGCDGDVHLSSVTGGERQWALQPARCCCDFPKHMLLLVELERFITATVKRCSRWQSAGCSAELFVQQCLHVPSAGLARSDTLENSVIVKA